MKKYCSECGASLGINSKFCNQCGKKNYSDEFENNHGSQTTPKIYPTSYPKKNSKNTGINVIAIIIVVMVILVTIFVFSGYYGKDRRFIGTWESDSMIGKSTFTLYSDGSFQGMPGSNPFLGSFSGNWDTKGNQLVFYMGSGNTKYELASYTFSFSNNDKTMTLTTQDIIGQTTTYIYNKQ